MAALSDKEIKSLCKESDGSTKLFPVTFPLADWFYPLWKNKQLMFTIPQKIIRDIQFNILKNGGILILASDKSKEICGQDFIFQQTMYRIKDPKKSLPFYTEVLGMRLLKKLDFPEMNFSLYFMGFENAADIPKDEQERTPWAMSRKATLELTHNWGTENDDTTFHSGNSDPRGFGHIGLMVPDVQAACDRFEKFGVEFVKKPQDGKMKGIAFIKDPDGYWIEIFNAGSVCKMLKQ